MKNKYNVILLGVFIISLVILVIILNLNNKENNIKEDNIKGTYSLVKDYNDFYTIENCANKYYGYLGSNNLDNLNKLLDEEYKNNNQFTNNYIDKNVGIKINEMYNYKNNYYLKGYVYEELKNGVNKLNEEYLLIKLSNDSKLFTITPINESTYNGVINGK
mgnify:FL=1